MVLFASYAGEWCFVNVFHIHTYIDSFQSENLEEPAAPARKPETQSPKVNYVASMLFEKDFYFRAASDKRVLVIAFYSGVSFHMLGGNHFIFYLFLFIAAGSPIYV